MGASAGTTGPHGPLTIAARLAAGLLALALIPGAAFWLYLNTWAAWISAEGICSDVRGCTEGDPTTGIILAVLAVAAMVAIAGAVVFGFRYATTGHGPRRLLLSFGALAISLLAWYVTLVS